MAGASMKDIKLRIRSVESTMQITKAMQLVATSKLRRAKERMENSKPVHPHLHRRYSGCRVLLRRPQRSLRHPPWWEEPLLCALSQETAVWQAVTTPTCSRLSSAHAEGTDACVLPLGRKAIERCHRLGLTMTDRRLSPGGGHVGWARVIIWRGCCWMATTRSGMMSFGWYTPTSSA